MGNDVVTWEQVRRRQLAWGAVGVGSIVLLLVGLDLVSRLLDGRTAIVAGGAVIVGSLAVGLGALVMQLRVMTEPARHALRTGEVPPGAASADLEKELTTRRGTQSLGLFLGAACVVMVPVGALIAVLDGSGERPPSPWAIALVVGFPLVSLVGAAWTWPRWRRVGAALRALRG